jgi:hypothetical protein
MAADGSGGAGVPGASREPTVDPDWLAARVTADTAARAPTIDTLLPELVNYLIKTTSAEALVEIIDLGAGTGANQRWLAPRLPFRQRWIHLDHDPIITRSLPLPDETMVVDESVEALEHLLRGPSRGVRVVTCSALLDVLTTQELDAICRAVIESQVPALFSLTVTGMLTISPTDAHDQLLLDAFNDHQRRAGRAGPNATALVVKTLQAGGLIVRTQETPWQLTTASADTFVEQVLQERLDVAVAQDPSLAVSAAAWLELRRTQLARGILRIDLDHRDILALPARAGPAARGPRGL